MMSDLIINLIIVFISLLIASFIFRKKELREPKKIVLTGLTITISNYILSAIILWLYLLIFGQFNVVSDAYVVVKMCIVSSIAIFISAYFALIFVDKLSKKQSMGMAIFIAIFGNSMNWILFFMTIIGLSGGFSFFS